MASSISGLQLKLFWQRSVLLKFHSCFTQLPGMPGVSAQITFSSTCGELAWIQVPASVSQSWYLSDFQAELTVSVSLFQKPKGRPTFAELLQVLTEIAETW